MANTFQPVQTVVPPKDDDQLISPANQNYMRALLTLQSSVEQLSTQNPPSDAGVAQVPSDAASAKVITKQIAQGFRPDPAGHVDTLVQTLMQEPIVQVEGLLKVLGPAELNGKGKGLCAQARSLWLTYPFNPNSTADAVPAQIDTFFRKPDGAIWTFYDHNFQKLLLPQGLQYIPNPRRPDQSHSGFSALLQCSIRYIERSGRTRAARRIRNSALHLRQWLPKESSSLGSLSTARR